LIIDILLFHVMLSFPDYWNRRLELYDCNTGQNKK
jgi:hypothetical protein